MQPSEPAYGPETILQKKYEQRAFVRIQKVISWRMDLPPTRYQDPRTNNLLNNIRHKNFFKRNILKQSQGPRQKRKRYWSGNRPDASRPADINISETSENQARATSSTVLEAFELRSRDESTR